MQDLKNLSLEEKQKILDEVNKEEDNEVKHKVVTEVTSIAKEEARTGKKIEVPAADQLVAMAGISLIKRQQEASQLMYTMSKKQIIRAVNAFLALPQEGLPVHLKDKKEVQLFSVGQRAIQDRFTIILHHINQEIAQSKLKQQEPVNENQA